jgi:hypothetical protein
VARSAVLPRGRRTHRSPCADGIAAATHTVERPDISESETLEPRKRETAARARYVPERVAPGIAVFRRIGCLADTDAIKNDDGRTLQPRSPV